MKVNKKAAVLLFGAIIILILTFAVSAAEPVALYDRGNLKMTVSSSNVTSGGYVNGYHYANGVAGATGGDNVAVDISVDVPKGADYIKIGYKRVTKNHSWGVDTNLGVTISGANGRLWGSNTSMTNKGVSGETIITASKFTGGENSKSWADMVDGDRYRYLRFKPWGTDSSVAIAEGDYIAVQYVAFFETLADAQNYVYTPSDAYEPVQRNVTFLVDGEVFATASLLAGNQTGITYPETNPEKFDYDFIGWDIPEGTVIYADTTVNAVFEPTYHDTMLEVGNVKYYKDSTGTVEVPVYVNHNKGIISVIANATYDSDLKLVGVRNEKLIETSYCGTGSANFEKNPYKIYFSDSLRTTDITNNGKFVTLIFEVPEGAEIGTEYEISLSEGKAYNAKVKKMPLEYRNGKITVVENKINVTFKDWNGNVIDTQTVKYGEAPAAPKVAVENMGNGTGRAFDGWDTDITAVKGDVVVTAEYREFVFGDADKDGALTLLDGVVLARNIADWLGYEDTVVDTVACDVNMDGSTGILDDLIIWRHHANWGGYKSLPLA